MDGFLVGTGTTGTGTGVETRGPRVGRESSGTLIGNVPGPKYSAINGFLGGSLRAANQTRHDASAGPHRRRYYRRGKRL